jgi:hypothetical protein
LDAFSYLAVLLSIIVGLAITQLLSGVGRMLQARDRIRIYWPSLAWLSMLLMIDIQTWWSMFAMRPHRDWNFFAFLVVLAQPTILYLLAILVLPDFSTPGVLDFRENYYSQRRWFFGLLVVLLIASIGKDVVLSGTLPDRLNFGGQLIFLVGSASLAITPRERYHKAMAPIAVLMFAAYIATLFTRLR